MEDTKLLLQYSTYLKNAFCVCLQQAFANSATPEEYRYSQDESLRQISIYSAFPKRTFKWPLIVVSAGMGDVSIDKLGQEIVREEDENGVERWAVFSGKMTIPIILNVEGETPTDRNMVTDITGIFVRYVFRDLFAKYRISYLDIESGEDGEEDNKNAATGRIFKGRVEVKCYMEFEQKVDLSCYDEIQDMDLSGILAGTVQQDLTPIADPEQV
jgi:hypothetical protein